MESRVIKNYLYYKIKEDRIEYLGNRMFRWDQRPNDVTQIYMGGGEPKKGRNASVGIYMISAPTFFSNYLAMGYAIPCTKREYIKAFKQIIKVLE